MTEDVQKRLAENAAKAHTAQVEFEDAINRRAPIEELVEASRRVGFFEEKTHRAAEELDRLADMQADSATLDRLIENKSSKQ